ncbi:hypothetical protein PB72LOC_04000 [Pectobacterium atrosepticum]|nr:hypothetical protein PB72LOC_04000 [Pectobacterium atrosepticum]
MSRIGRGDIARRIARGDRRTDITIGGQHRSRYIHTPGLAIGIHRGLIGLGADFYRHRIAGFHFITDVTGHRNRLTRLAGVNHIIGGDVVDRNGRRWRNRIDTVSVIRVCRGDIACGIACGDSGTHITIRGQHRTRHVDDPGLAIGIDGGLVGLGADSDRHRIARFHVVIDITRHRDGLTGFTGVNHVIGGDVINSNRRGGCHGIDAVSMTGIGSSDIACGIAGRHGRTHIAVRSQHRTRYVDAPGFTVGIHRRLVGLGTDGDRHRIARFNFIADVTGHRDGLARLAGIDHVIRRDIVDSNRSCWRHRIDAVRVAGIGGGDIARRIAGGHGRRNITVRR